MAGYNEPPEQAVMAPMQGYPQQYDDYGGYTYPGDMWAGRPSNDQSAQVRQAIFECKLPEKDEEFRNWIGMMRIAIDAVARIPGIDAYDIDRLNRKFKFIINRANSQGCKAMTESRMQEFVFLLRSYVAKGDVPLQGLTGVSAMITTHSNQKTEMRYPVQQSPTFGLGDIVKMVRGK